MKTRKQWIVMLLMLAMLFTALPIAAFAEGEPAEPAAQDEKSTPPEKENAGETIKPMQAPGEPLKETPKPTKRLFIHMSYAKIPGKGHTTQYKQDKISPELANMYQNLTITIKGGEKTHHVPKYFIDAKGNKSTNDLYRDGGEWPVGTKLTVTINTDEVKAPYHISHNDRDTDGTEGGIITSGYETFEILTLEAPDMYGQSNRPLMIELGQMSVKFDPQGGKWADNEAPITHPVKNDNTVEFPVDPKKEGLHFANWYTQTATGKHSMWDKTNKFSDYNRDWVPFNDKNVDPLYDGIFLLRALWEAEVTFNTGNGGTAIAPVRVEEGKTLTAPQEPTRSGYVFKGWKTQDDNDFNFNTPVTKDMTLTAKWEKKPSSGGSDITTDTTIYVDPNGGQFSDGSTAVKSYAVTVGERFTLPEAPIREGYKFLYWKGSEYQPGDQYTVEAGGHTFVAEWEKAEKKPEDKPSAPSVDSNIKTPRGSALTHEEIAKILAGMKNTVPAIPKAGVGR